MRQDYLPRRVDAPPGPEAVAGRTKQPLAYGLEYVEYRLLAYSVLKPPEPFGRFFLLPGFGMYCLRTCLLR